MSYSEGARLLSVRDGEDAPVPGGPSTAGAPGAGGDARLALGREACRAFIRSGVKGPEDVRFPTGIGGFEVAYDPAQMIEFVRIGAAVQFRNAIDIEDGKAVAREERAEGFARILRRDHQGDPLRMVEAVSAWQWTEGEKAAWLSRLEASVQERWSRQFLFHATADGWDGLQAWTDVDVTAREAEPGSGDHLVVEVFKTPPEHALDLGRLVPGTGGPRDNRMFLEARDVAAEGDFLQQAFRFEDGTADLERASYERLKAWAVTFQAASNAPPKVRIRVQGQGTRLVDSARERYETLAAVLDAFGIAPERLAFDYTGPGSESFLFVGDGQAMVVAAHEFGHVLGLKDDYANDDGGLLRAGSKKMPAGTATGHDSVARSLGLPGSVHENHDGLMSLGNALRPAYGAPFLWALRKVTRREEWADVPRAPSARVDGGGR